MLQQLANTTLKETATPSWIVGYNENRDLLGPT